MSLLLAQSQPAHVYLQGHYIQCCFACILLCATDDCERGAGDTKLGIALLAAVPYERPQWLAVGWLRPGKQIVVYDLLSPYYYCRIKLYCLVTYHVRAHSNFVSPHDSVQFVFLCTDSDN